MTSGERMLPSERLAVDVEVLVDDTWWPGTLEHRRPVVGGGWQGYIRYSTGLAQNRLGWFDYEQIRRSADTT